MAKPSVYPIWNATEVNVAEPDATRQSTGWVVAGGIPEKPPFEYDNFLKNNVYKWVKYLDKYTDKVAEAIEKAGYSLIDDNLEQLHKAVKGLYVPTFTYNTSAIATQTVNDIVRGSDGKYYEAQADGVSGDNPVGSVTGNWMEVPFDSGFVLDILGLPEKFTLKDSDKFAIADSDDSFALKKMTWGTTFKTTILAYVDTLFSRTLAIFGIGQTWQDFTGVRLHDVIYTNTTGRPIEVSISGDLNGTYIKVDGVNVHRFFSASASTGSVVVPNNSTYEKTGTAANIWAELR